MPATSIFSSDLSSMLGRSLEGRELESAMLGCKAKVEAVEGNEIKLEILDSEDIKQLKSKGKIDSPLWQGQ